MSKLFYRLFDKSGQQLLRILPYIVIVDVHLVQPILHRHEPYHFALVQGDKPKMIVRCLKRIIVVFANDCNIHHQRSDKRIQLRIGSLKLFYYHGTAFFQYTQNTSPSHTSSPNSITKVKKRIDKMIIILFYFIYHNDLFTFISLPFSKQIALLPCLKHNMRIVAKYQRCTPFMNHSP